MLNDQDIARAPPTVIYLGLGVFHIVNPDFFMSSMPSRIPRPKLVVMATGICEIAGAVGLFTLEFRYAASLALVLYAICVFPVNIKHAVYKIPVGGLRLNWWYHVPRLAFQPVFVWWALFAGRIVG